jgi:hypothetical protein
MHASGYPGSMGYVIIPKRHVPLLLIEELGEKRLLRLAPGIAVFAATGRNPRPLAIARLPLPAVVPSVLAVNESLELAPIQKEAAALGALVDDDTAALVLPHRAVALRTDQFHPRTLAPAISPKRKPGTMRS